MKNKNTSIYYLVQGAILSVLIYVLTCFVKVPSINGYVHIGDALVFLSASVLPPVYACASAIIGAGLSDILGGYMIWVPATVLIKGLTALCFTRKGKRVVSVRNLLAIIPALILCAGGYYLYEAIFIVGNFVSPLVSILPNVVQTVTSAVIYVIIGAVIDSRKSLKKMFTNSKDSL